MKIGFINNSYYPIQFGGAERSVQLLAESVVRLGHQATVLTNSTTSKREQREVNGIGVVYLPHKNLYTPQNISKNPLTRIVWHMVDSYNPWMGADVLRWLESENPDVVHTNVIGGFSVSAWDAIRKYGAPLVHTLREYYLQCRLMSLNRKGVECGTPCAFCRVCALPRRARSSQPHAVVGISRYILDSHIQAGFFAGVAVREVIFNPVLTDDNIIKPRASSERIRLGFIGRLESLKGIDFLLQEIQTLPRDKYELYIAGAGDTAYTKKIRSHDFGMPVHWLGHVSPSDFFNKIDLLVVPSLWQEPFGRVIVEAYSYGIPVMASRVGGISEIVDENTTGFLFDPFVRGNFNKKLSGVTLGICLAMRKACLEKSRAFEPDRIGRQYLELFSRIKERYGSNASFSDSSGEPSGPLLL